MTWQTPLSRPIMLGNKDVLRTLGDAARFVVEKSEGLLHSEVAVVTGELLLAAAESGRAEDITDATEQTVIFLESRGLLPRDYIPAKARRRPALRH